MNQIIYNAYFGPEFPPAPPTFALFDLYLYLYLYLENQIFL